HLLPFKLSGTCAYLISGKMVGASKLVRAFRAAAASLGTQEMVVERAAQEVAKLAGTENVAVFAIGTHLCMAARGVKTNAKMITSRLMGAFRSNSDLRTEVLRLIHISSGDGA
ncbi:MAG: GTP cyclohydrolase I, partial [Candidatus Methanomethylicaceae archaeon]